MERIPEPELMDGSEQARAYAEADFAAPHQRFVALFQETAAGQRPGDTVIDLGCGPADVLVRFAHAFPHTTLLGIDGAAAMLEHGRRRVAAQGLAARIRLQACHLPVEHWPFGRFPVVISNSLLHHLHEPQVLWSTVRACALPGARIFVMDLLRPASRARAQALVDEYAAAEPAVLREDFFNSLCAAFTVAEVRAQLQAAGLDELAVREVSDRHLIVSGYLRDATS